MKDVNHEIKQQAIRLAIEFRKFLAENMKGNLNGYLTNNQNAEIIKNTEATFENILNTKDKQFTLNEFKELTGFSSKISYVAEFLKNLGFSFKTSREERKFLKDITLQETQEITDLDEIAMDSSFYSQNYSDYTPLQSPLLTNSFFSVKKNFDQDTYLNDECLEIDNQTYGNIDEDNSSFEINEYDVPSNDSDGLELNSDPGVNFFDF